MTRYFEDLAVGDVLESSGYTVTADEIVEFAEQFDPQSFHVDPDAAEDSMFGGLVASGLHTLCLSVRLFVTEFTQGSDAIANMGGSGLDELRWYEPVRPGDTLRVRTEVLERRPSESRDDRGYVDFRRSVTVDGDEVLSFVSHNIVARADAET
jgi:acyl dehydratase